jgi:hypothetical protein
MGVKHGIAVRAKAREAGGYGDSLLPVARCGGAFEGLQFSFHLVFSCLYRARISLFSKFAGGPQNAGKTPGESRA